MSLKGFSTKLYFKWELKKVSNTVNIDANLQAEYSPDSKNM